MKSILVLLAAISVNAFANPLADLPAKVVALHQALSEGCEDEQLALKEVHDLGWKKKLYVIPCAMGAYQGYGHAFISSGEGDEMYVQPVAVLGYNESSKGVEPQYELGSVGYDPKTKVLSTFAKGRGIGDCGQATISKIHSEEWQVWVKTIEVRAKPKCDGKETRWPVVFKQK